MPNFLEALRLKNIFGLPEGGMVGNDLPSQGGITGRMPIPDDPFGARKPSPFEGIFGDGMEMQSPNMDRGPVSPAPMGDGMSDIASRMTKMYTPETQATDRFNRMIDEAPVRNKPGMLRKIASIVAGTVGGPEMFDMSMYGNFNREMEDWKAKTGPAQQAATLERQSNVNERTLAYQTIAAELREQAQQAKEANDSKRTQIAQQRADVYEYRAKNPNMKFDFSGPTVKVADPTTGKIADTGIPTGNLSDADKLALGQEQALKRISATGAERRTTQEEGHEQELTEIEARGEEARSTRRTPSGAGTGKDELPTQTRVRQFNAARELLNTDPELKQFIKLGSPGSNDFTITPPGESRMWGHTGPTTEQYEKINAAIYGGAMTRNAPAEPIYKTQRNTATGATRRVMSTDGGKTWKPTPAGK